MKIKVEVVGAYVDGHGPGSIISVDEKSAKYLESIGYAKIQKDVEEVKQPKEVAKFDKPKAESKGKPKGKAKDKK
jgi:hypothetical protein